MRLLVSGLMAVLLLANAVFGCCRHSMLACGLPDRVSNKPGASSTPESADACCCHHGQDEQDEQSERHAPCECSLDCYGACTFLPTEKSETELADAVAPLDLVPLIDRLLTAGYDGDAGPNAASPSTGYSPPVRLHLLHQSLLV
jgi:hypothetical protein